eukprot:TRINITY_DN13276_c0_g2_i1.p1 TRINITY_DN13276_c0_g2~~TRINITY_DN13276_c0_g2_i1.p1  ORF type:complete len:174 (+),score=12.53 TRINITY_DN13276_c0_g2_i1:29-523(+)
MEDEVLPYHFLKVLTLFVNIAYAVLQLVQIIGVSIYVFYSFGDSYKVPGILINCLLCLFRTLNPIIAMNICNGRNKKQAEMQKKLHCFLLFATIIVFIGGAAGYLVLHGFITLESEGGISAVIVLILLAVDFALYVPAWLCARKLSIAMIIFFASGLKILNNRA